MRRIATRWGWAGETGGAGVAAMVMRMPTGHAGGSSYDVDSYGDSDSYSEEGDAEAALDASTYDEDGSVDTDVGGYDSYDDIDSYYDESESGEGGSGGAKSRRS